MLMMDEEQDYNTDECVEILRYNNKSYINVSREFALERGVPAEVFDAALAAQKAAQEAAWMDEEQDYNTDECVEILRYNNKSYINVSREFALERGVPAEVFDAALAAQKAAQQAD